MNIPDYQNYSPNLPENDLLAESPTSDFDLEVHHSAPEYATTNPALDSLLEDICERGNCVIEPISSHICALQEMFLDTLYNRMEEAGIDLSEKLTVFQTQGGHLAVLGEHPEKKRVEALLAATPALSEVFTTLSSHSEIARDIVNINRIFHSMHAAGESGAESASGYHLSLKGGMSHFYFV